jgi:class 3 adenylate cyclase
MRRKLLGLLGFGTGLFAGSVVYRRSFGRRRERVDVYYGDGSMVSFAEGAPEADTLLAVARDALTAVRP